MKHCTSSASSTAPKPSLLMAQVDVVQNLNFISRKSPKPSLICATDSDEGEPVVTIAPLSWKNAKEIETAFNLSLMLKIRPQTRWNATAGRSGSFRQIAGCETDHPVDMAMSFMTQIATRLEGYQQEEAAGLAKQQVNGLAAMGQMFRITALQDNVIGTSLQYANGGDAERTKNAAG